MKEIKLSTRNITNFLGGGANEFLDLSRKSSTLLDHFA